MKIRAAQLPRGRRSAGGRFLVEPLESRIAPANATPFPLGSLNGTNGFSVSGAGQVGNDSAIIGDVNGDGFDDVLLGVFGTASAGYVLFGKADGFNSSVDLATLAAADGFKVENPSGPALTNFGITAGALGDVNGDGFADFAVGADAEKVGVNSGAGAVYVVFGRASFPTTLDVATLTGANGFKLTGLEASEFLGVSIASTGDMNADGFADFVVTASGANGGFNGKGAAYVVFGQAAGFGASLSVSTLDGATGFKVNGENSKDFLNAAAAAGDVNGDGFGDLILGAGFSDAKGANSGAAYVVFGKGNGFAKNVNLASLKATEGFKMRGEMAGDYAGFAVSSAGDFNGDGFADLLIGAQNANRGAPRTGAAYVVFGKNTPFANPLDLSKLDGLSGIKLTGAAMNDAVGYAVSGGGDVNGDGFDDAIIGARLVGGAYGGAYVIYGKASGFAATTALASLQEDEGFPITGTLGYRVSGGGDVNGDGLDDVLLGARDFSRAYLVFGFDSGAITHRGDSGSTTLNGDANANVIIAGQAGDTLLGNGGADVLRGGEGDDVLAIGDLGFQRLHGGNGIDTLRLDGAGLSLDFTAIRDPKIQSVERLDLTGSGANTLTLSVREVLNLAPNSNTLTVLGDADDRVNFGPGWILFGEETIGATVFEVFISGAATLKVASAVSTPLPTGYHPHALDGEVGSIIAGQGFGQFGRSLASAGDVNGDGFDDMIFGDYTASFPGGSGAAYVVFGSASGLPANLAAAALNGTNGFRITGTPATVTSFGAAVSGAGDVNGDGFADVIVGGFNESPNASKSGAAFVIFGQAGGFSASVSVTELNTAGKPRGFKMIGNVYRENVGAAVGGAGDVNGDGFDDVIVGAGGADFGGANAGAAYVVFGKAGTFATNVQLAALTGTDGFRVTGAEKNTYLGSSVNSAGDLNGDGFDDVVVGSISSGANGASSGAAYVVYGKSSFAVEVKAGTGGFRIKGAAAGDRLGFGSGSAGDVNGDGFGDLLVGAFSSDANGTDSGAAYVLFGRSAPFAGDIKLTVLDGTNGFRLVGAKPGDLAGYSASAAGDVNGDGFDDMLVGASGGIFSGAPFGDTFVVYGKAAFTADFNLGTVDGGNGFKLVRAAAGDGSASAVSRAGDVNGDGLDDVISGAFFTAGGGVANLIYGFDSGKVTQTGGPGADSLTATAGADVLVAGRGNDTLLQLGFQDALRGGQGDDVFSFTGGPVLRLNGGHGTDTILLTGNLLYDLSSKSSYRISNIEQVDLRPGVNYLSLDYRAVLNVSPDTNTLIVRADPGDVVNIGAGWTATGSEVIDGDTFTVLTQGAAILKVSTFISPVVTLVNATTATYTDVDGDLVTIKVSKGVLGISDFFLRPAGTVGGAQLEAINFGDDGIEFQGSDLSITAQRTVVGGDGNANVGRLDVSGVDFGKVTIDGDLGRFDAGDSVLTTPGLEALNVGSLGVFGSSTQGAGGSTQSAVLGELGSLTVRSDIRNAYFFVKAAAGGMGVGTLNIGGSFISEASQFAGFQTTGSVGAIKIGGDLRGLSGAAGILAFDVGGNIGGLTIGGSFAVDAATTIGAINAGGTFGAIKIGGDFSQAKVSAVKSFSSITIDGSVLSSRVLGGLDLFEKPTNADATIGAVKVGGDWVASSLVAGVVSSDPYLGNGGETLLASGSPAIPGGDPTNIAKVTSIAIDGQVLGTVGGADYFGFVAEEFGSFSVGGTKFPLVKGAANDLAGLAVGATFDVKVREAGLIASPVENAGGGNSSFPLASLDGANGFRFDGETGATAGRSIAGVGDVNGDGIDDIIIGAPGADVAGAQDAGEAYVIFGSRNGFDPSLNPAALDGTNGFRISRGTASAQFGLAVGAAGDVNGDGFADVIVGQIESFGLAGSQTSAFVVFGKATPFSPTLDVTTLNGTNGFQVLAPINPQNGIAFRMGVSGAGDLNNDGRDDVILGVYNSPVGAQFAGSDYVFFSPTAGSPATLDGGALTGSNGFRFDASTGAQGVGYSVSEAGDINGDGIDDIILGSPNETVTQNRQGAAYVIYGKTSAYPSVLNSASVMAGGGVLGFRILGVADLDITGASVDSAGDVNGDGFDDVVIGAPYADGPAQYSGATYVIYGKLGSFGSELALASLTASQGFRISGEGKYDYAGRVAGVRDVNGDGFDDILIGAIGQEAEFEFKGAAYLIYGRAGNPASVSVSSGLKLSGVAGADETGGAVAGAGDLNGDGRPDLLIGADRTDDGGNFAGSAYVVFQIAAAAEVQLSNGGKTATFNDVDGDLVTIKTTAGQFVQSDFTLLKTGELGGAQLQRIDLSGATHNGFDGANITITAAHGPLGGDGFINVGALIATDQDLGKISIDGDLGQLDAGNGNPLKSAVAALTVQSLGRLGLSTQAAAGASLESNIKGKLGAFTVKSDIVGAFVNIDGSADDGDDDGGAITIGGSIRGGALANSGSIFAAGDLGAVKVGGSVLGAAGSHSGSIESGGEIASAMLAGSLLGGTGLISGSLIAGTALGAVKIGGDLTGGRILATGHLLPTNAALATAIKSIVIEGSVSRTAIFAGYGRDGAPVNADVWIGSVSVGRDWVASDLVAGLLPVDLYYGNDDELIPGGNGTVSEIASIVIKGQALGTINTVSSSDHFGFVAEEIRSFKLGSTAFKLVPGKLNDSDGLIVGATADLRVREEGS